MNEGNNYKEKSLTINKTILNSVIGVKLHIK